MNADNSNEPTKKDIQDQVKNLLSGISGEAGEFLSQSVSGKDQGQVGQDRGWGVTKPVSFGHLLHIILAYRCEDNHVHIEQYTPEGFERIYSGETPQGYFDNFSAIGMFQAGGQPQPQPQPAALSPAENARLGALLAKAAELEKEKEQSRKHMKYVQALHDEEVIRNSHLKVENDGLKRELARLNQATRSRSQVQQQEVEEPTQTALDFKPQKRRWTFGFGFRKIRLIGGEGQ